jgi:hypothetical protein
MNIQDWSTKRELLTAKVEKLFAEAGGRLQPPARDSCRRVAGALIAVRVRNDAASQRKDATLRARKGARISGKAFLRHLKPIRSGLAGVIATYETDDYMATALAPYRVELERLDAVVGAVGEFLPALKKAPIAPVPDLDPIIHIAHEAQKSWAKANNGRRPEAKGGDQPLVKVVVGALALINMNLSRDTVSSVLRRRRRTKEQQTYPKMSAEGDTKEL